MSRFLKNFVIIALILFGSRLYAQSELEDPDELNGRDLDFNILQYALPFLTIAPDSRAGAMGDAGAATTPDINSMHWNPSKYAMIDGDGGVSLSYTPWLRKLVPDIDLLYLSGFYRLDDKQVIGGSLLYFSLGEIQFTNDQGDPGGQHTPNEFAIDATYARLLTEKLSMGVAFRFMRSDITGNLVEQSKAGISFAADYSMYYSTDLEIDEKESELAFGLNISNMGRKVSYSEDNRRDEFIPTNLRLGSRLTMDLDEYNQISLTADINKLLIPTPEYIEDTVSNNNSDIGPAEGMFKSFYDAPRGFEEEMEEIMISIGAEYWYSQQFAIRAGYFNEAENKGNRKYFTLGIGLKLNVITLDFAYLVPTSGRQNPLANTTRFTLSFEFNKFKK